MSDSFENQVARLRYYEALAVRLAEAEEHREAIVQTILKDRCACLAHRPVADDDFIGSAISQFPIGHKPSMIYVIPHDYVTSIRQDELDAMEEGWRNVEIKLGKTDSFTRRGMPMTRIEEFMKNAACGLTGASVSTEIAPTFQELNAWNITEREEMRKDYGINIRTDHKEK